MSVNIYDKSTDTLKPIAGRITGEYVEKSQVTDSLNVTEPGFVVDAKTLSGAFKDFVIKRTVNLNGIAITNGQYINGTIDASVPGYKALGVVGYYYGGSSTARYISPFNMYIDSENGQLNYYLAALGGNVSGCSGGFEILYVKII